MFRYFLSLMTLIVALIAFSTMNTRESNAEGCASPLYGAPTKPVCTGDKFCQATASSPVVMIPRTTQCPDGTQYAILAGISDGLCKIAKALAVQADKEPAMCDESTPNCIQVGDLTPEEERVEVKTKGLTAAQIENIKCPKYCTARLVRKCGLSD